MLKRKKKKHMAMNKYPICDMHCFVNDACSSEILFRFVLYLERLNGLL